MTDVDTKSQEEEPRQASAISGCLIFCILIIVFTFLGSYITWTYFDLKAAAHQISQEHPITLPVTETKAKQTKALEKKFSTFATAVRDEKKASLALSIEELNLALSHFDKLSELKGKMHISKFNPSKGEGEDKTPATMDAQITFPIKGGITEANRHLNADIKIEPSIEMGSFFPKLTEVKPHNGSEFPEKALKFLPQAFSSSYRVDPDIQDVFHKLSSVELNEDQLIITSDPDYVVPAQGGADTELGDDNFFVALSIFGILFFIFFSTSLFIWWFRKNNKRQKELAAQQEAQQLEQEQAAHEQAEE